MHLQDKYHWAWILSLQGINKPHNAHDVPLEMVLQLVTEKDVSPIFLRNKTKSPQSGIGYLVNLSATDRFPAPE